MQGYVYILINNNGVVFYVGCTMQLEKRKKAHIAMTERLRVHSYINKYKVNPVFAIIEEAKVESKKELMSIESKWIKHFLYSGIKLQNFQRYKLIKLNK